MIRPSLIAGSHFVVQVSPPPALFPPNPTQEAHQYSPILSARPRLESRIRAVRFTENYVDAEERADGS